jgi:hypothetical protein
VPGGDEGDAELLGRVHVRLLGLAGHVRVVALARRLQELVAAGARGDGDALELLGAEREDEGLAIGDGAHARHELVA